MGIQEKEFIDCYREMMAEKGGVNITTDGLATLTAACVLKQTLEGLKKPDKYSMTIPQASAILGMDCIASGEGQGLNTDEDQAGWDALVYCAEIITGDKADWRS